MDQDATLYDGRQFGPGNIVLDANPAPPQGAQPPPSKISAMSVVAKQLDGSRCHLVRRQASAKDTLC